MVIATLKKLLNNNSNSLFELYTDFRDKYPKEKGLIDLLQDKLFSEEENNLRDETIVRMLNNLLSEKA